MEKDQIIVKSTEVYTLKDGTSRKLFERGPKGWVEIFSREKDGILKLVSKCNLIILQGRELIGQLLTYTLNPNNVVSKNGEHIYWFGLGTGGSTTSDPFNPTPPNEDDTDLYYEVPISALDSTTCTDYGFGHDGHAPNEEPNGVTYPGRSQGYYKHKLDQVEFEIDPANNNAWLVTKITITIGIEDALNSPEFPINEAGLFTSETNTPAQARADQYHLFARITFPSVIKTNTRELIFLWYIYT